MPKVRCPMHLSIRVNTIRAMEYLEALRARRIDSFIGPLEDGCTAGVSTAPLEWALVECGAMECAGAHLNKWRWKWDNKKVTHDQAMSFQRALSRIVQDPGKKGEGTVVVIDGKRIANFKTPHKLFSEKAARAAEERRQQKLDAEEEKRKAKAAGAQQPLPIAPPKKSNGDQPMLTRTEERFLSLERLVAALDGRMADVAHNLKALEVSEQLAALVNQTNRIMVGHDTRCEKLLASIGKYLEELLDKKTAPAPTA